MADALHKLTLDAEAGSDLQLTYAHGFVSVATSADHLALIRGLLDGTSTIDGLAIDTDLRWSLLRRLVVRGAAGETDIDAELVRDATAAGERHAAACRSAIPTAEAKAAAWQRIINGTELTNAIFRSTLGGFVDDNVELLTPYVEKYFAEVGRVWSTWSSDMSSTFAEVAYPFLVISPDTVNATTTYLEEQNPPSALRQTS